MPVKRLFVSLIIILLLGSCGQLHAQDTSTLYGKFFHLPDKLFAAIDKKSEKYQEKLIDESGKYLSKFARKEWKLKRKLAKKDSLAATLIFNGSDTIYRHLHQQLIQAKAKGQHLSDVYSGRIDSMQTALKFLDQSKLLGTTSQETQKLAETFRQFNDLQGKFNQVDIIQKYLEQRKQFLSQQLARFGFQQQLDEFKKEVYYYRQQMDAYKQTFEDPGKLEASLLGILRKQPAFQNFFRENSELGQFFNLPGASDQNLLASVAGLQTRTQLMKEIEQHMGAGTNIKELTKQQLSPGLGELNNMKDKINSLKSGSDGDISMPDFKPNAQRTKSFLSRLELGTNLQSTRSNNFYPTTTDIGLSVGYKINDKSTAGIGASYKVGWGKDVRHVDITHQGMGFRSYLDIKLKGSFWISGGGELNYRSQFNDFEILQSYTEWQKSALIGLTKKFKAGKKLKGNVQLLYDFLWRIQIPITQPVLFRIGYNF